MTVLHEDLSFTVFDALSSVIQPENRAVVRVLWKTIKITSQSLFVTAHLQRVKCVFVCVFCNELWGQSKQFKR